MWLPYDPDVPCLGTHLEDSTSYLRNTCLSVFVAAVFTTARK